MYLNKTKYIIYTIKNINFVYLTTVKKIRIENLEN